MLDLTVTAHAQTRLRQRGFKQADIEAVLSAATRLSGDAFFLSKRDAQREIEKRKREIQQFERLSGTELILVGEKLITAYHCDSSHRAKRHRHREIQS